MPADYSFLKPLFGEDGSSSLTFDQLSSALEAKPEVKIGDLADGAYVAKGKFDAIVAERDTLKTGKADADAKLSGYDPEWKAKSEAAQAAADAKVGAILLKTAAVDKLRAAGCKDPELAFQTLDASKIKIDGEDVLGIKEQIEASKKAHPFLFEPEGEQQKPGTGAGGNIHVTTGTRGKAQTGGDDQNVLDAIYANNPFYKKK